jgi:osmotically-inducible protein OsmY
MVATTSQRDRAIETASAVQGVAGVDDGITLRQRSASR